MLYTTRYHAIQGTCFGTIAVAAALSGAVARWLGIPTEEQDGLSSERGVYFRTFPFVLMARVAGLEGTGALSDPGH